MNNLFKKLQKDYEGYKFSSGPHTGDDFKSFQRRFRNALKKMAKEMGAELAAFNGGHYILSAFIERDGNFVYISISDVRFSQDGWIYDILIRDAEHEKDYSGGFNRRATIYDLQEKAEKMLSPVYC